MFGLILASLQSKVRELYNVVCRLEEEKYDWEFKLRKVDFEVRSLHSFGKPTSFESMTNEKEQFHVLKQVIRIYMLETAQFVVI